MASILLNKHDQGIDIMISGWTIARTIPHETLIGLITGKYQLCGGVVRLAAGNPNAGQIVQHLIPVGLNPLNIIPGLNSISGVVANTQLFQLSGQIHSLSESTQQILGIATKTAAFSGLGLIVSSIGFVVINNKLNEIDTNLKEIQKDVKEIRHFLESSERSRLFAALNELQKIDSRTAPEHRHTILHSVRTTLAEINMRYRELLSDASLIETAIAYEEYVLLTALAQARCSSELGMTDIACKEIQEINVFWQIQAQRIAKYILLGKHPERFLATDFAKDVSISELIQWLDFAHNQKKGLAWIDELRLKIDEKWYSTSWLPMGGSGLNQNNGIGLEKEQKILIPALRKLVSRSNILDGYVAQYEFLDRQKIKPSEFEQKLANIPKSSLVDGYIILEPQPSRWLRSLG